MNCNTYVTIAGESSAKVVIKKSTFLSFAYPVATVDEAEALLKDFKKKYYDARHVCFAYVLEADGSIMRAYDNGEPSGTAGRPIQGVIRAAGLTHVMVMVVRYFGGIKLGTQGLIAAYKEAAELALAKAEKVTHTVEHTLRLLFDYSQMNAVMQCLKRQEVKILSHQVDTHCTMELKVPQAQWEMVKGYLQKIPTLKFESEES
ncbi:MAG: YigZ family protein [Bacteroidaceae bacterium]|nr:YigZ family protein [Bacteroidaceae bacterium]